MTGPTGLGPSDSRQEVSIDAPWQGPTEEAITMRLELDDETTALLTRILTTYIADLRMEIADTDSPTFKAGLRREKEILSALLENLQVT
jgi:hypothetical protein